MWNAIAFLVAAAITAPISTMNVIDTKGDTHAVPAEKAPATVLFFTAIGCPVCNAYAPEMERLTAAYGKKGVVFLRVYPDPYLDASDIAEHTEAFGFTAPAVWDDDLAIARYVGVHMTPEVALITEDGTVVYRGRIDDRYADYGRQREEPTKRELVDALDAVLAGREVTTPTAEPLGCEIPFPIEAATESTKEQSE